MEYIVTFHVSMGLQYKQGMIIFKAEILFCCYNLISWMGIIAVVGRDYNDGPLILSGCLALMSKAEIVVKRLLSGSRPS